MNFKFWICLGFRVLDLKHLPIYNKTQNTLIAPRAKLADTFITRMVGLLNRSSLAEGEALVIARCQSIHMLFMKFSIDVIFVDKNNRVIGLVQGIKPFQLSKIFWKARFAIEVPIGTIAKTKTAVGDQLDGFRTS